VSPVPVVSGDEPVPAPGPIAATPSPDLKATGVDLDLLVDAAQPAFRRFAGVLPAFCRRFAGVLPWSPFR